MARRRHELGTNEGKWKTLTGSARERWGEITDSDWETIGGKKDQLVGRLQEQYGIGKEEAEKQADEWSSSLNIHLVR